VTLGRSAGVTDTGRRRRRNEDSYVCEPPLFAVADGMGGAQAGEVASRLAAAVLEEANGEELSRERVVELIREANRRVFRRSSEDAAASGMGTTMTVALVESQDTVAIGHVGDSRAYLVRDGRLEQLTEDHSLVAELMRSGKLSPEEAEAHPQRSVITRALGTEPDVDVDAFTVETQPGDVFLLCSDGLTTMVADDEILAVLRDSPGDLDAAARRLVEAANSSGGEDNITVVVFEIADAGAEETMRLPAAAATAGAAQDDDVEDTLSGLEPVPAVDTAVVPAEEVRAHLERQEGERQEGEREGARPATPARRRSDGRSLLPLVLLVVILLALALLVIWGLYR
jgi:serine/threonine protein phosphatase PrpC